MNNNDHPGTGWAEKFKLTRGKRLFVRIVGTAMLLLIAVNAYVVFWWKEEQKPFHRTKDFAYAMIETPYYSMKVPAKWRNYVSVQIEPVNEVYGGWDEDGQSKIWEENYQLQLSYKTDTGTYPVADIAMYQYLNDCLEQLDDWEYWGELTVGVADDSDMYRRLFLKDVDYNDCQLIIVYAAEPEGLTEEELDVWNTIKSSLSADMLQFEKDTENLYTKFSPRETEDPHGMAVTWDEDLQQHEEREKMWVEEEKERKKKEKEQQEAKEKEASSKSSGSKAKTCIYPGCRNYGVSYRKGYCNKHYEQLYGTRDDYYDEDPESYYQDNKSMYRSRSEAYEDWEDEYEED